MILGANNPHWPDHADFDCPACGGAIEDQSDYEFGAPNEEPEKHSCPHCHKDFKAWVKVTWEYKVEI